MKLLIKIGGTLIDNDERRDAIAPEIAALGAQAHQCVVVHGGGKQLSRYLNAQGIRSEFRGGLRVTPPEIMDAVLRIFAGSVNHHLVAALQREGVKAVGLSGIDAGMVQARQLSPDLGAVGEVESVDSSLLEHLSSQGYLPVVACVAGGKNGEIYNVNADQMAVACAADFGADPLIFLTDVEGVLDENGQRLPRLTSAQAGDLIESGVAQGGMEAKLRAAVAGISKGIPSVRIASGASPRVLERIIEDGDIGTEINSA